MSTNTSGNRRRFLDMDSSLIWQVLAALLLLTLGTYGCNSGSGGGSGAAVPMGPVAPAETPSQPGAGDAAFARVPQVVRDAFDHDYRRVATVDKVQHHLHPDGQVHYTINFTDKSGVARAAEYRADGVRIAP